MNEVQKHNEPLRQAHFKLGYKWKTKNGIAYFVDDTDKYVPFPVGYITGPTRDRNREGFSYMSVYLGESGWAQRTMDNGIELEQWALERAKEAKQCSR